MVHACIINGCPSVSGKNLGLFYYRLPKDEILRKRWMDMITPKPGLIPNDNSLICSRHFKEIDYVNYAKRILRKNAVPTMVPLLDHEQEEMTVDEIKDEQSSTDCESDVELVPDEQMETIKIEETDTSNYNEDSTIRVVDVESILKNQVETSSSSENATVASNAQPQHNMKEQSLREAFQNFTGNTNSMVTQGNAPGSVPTVISNNDSLSNFIYVSQQQQKSPNSLLIELLPMSFPQTSQAPLAIQPTQQIQPIQQNGMLVRPVYVQDKKSNQQRLVGTQIINPQSLHAGMQKNQQQQIVGLQNIQPIVLPQNTQQIVLPQNVQPIVKQHSVAEQNDQKFIVMKSEVLEQTADIQTRLEEPKIRSRPTMNGGPKGVKRKPQKVIRNVGVSPKKTNAKVVVPINKNQNTFSKLKVNYEKLQRKYDEIRAILDLVQEKKLNVEHIKDFYTTTPKRNTQNANDSVSCGVWWRGSGFVGTRPN